MTTWSFTTPLSEIAQSPYGAPEPRKPQKCIFPDPPILAFFDFLAFFPIFLAFFFCVCVCFPSFPRILGVPRREKPLFFSGFPVLFFKKARVGGSGLKSEKRHISGGSNTAFFGL